MQALVHSKLDMVGARWNEQDRCVNSEMKYTDTMADQRTPLIDSFSLIVVHICIMYAYGVITSYAWHYLFYCMHTEFYRQWVPVCWTNSKDSVRAKSLYRFKNGARDQRYRHSYWRFEWLVRLERWPWFWDVPPIVFQLSNRSRLQVRFSLSFFLGPL